MEPMRIVLYSHDSVGLGHVRRNLALAHALNNQLPGLIGRPVTGILITGTALAPAFRLPEGWDWVLLPGVAKGSAGYLPRNLALPMHELVPLRASLLQATLAGFAPHLVVVDRHATGVHGELEIALRRARTAGPVRVVLGLREVLDSPAAALSEWARLGGPRVVKALFDAIWVYGDPAVHDPVACGEIPFALRKLIRYTGYLAEGRPSVSGTSCMPGRYFMTTVGGGSDGYALARIAVAAPVPDGLGHLLVAGPQMPAEQLNDLRQHARPGVKVVSAVDDIVFHIRHAAAVVAMGGYNTVCEIMSTPVPALIVPRTQSRAEQQIRAASLAAAGYLEQHDIGTLTPEILAGWLAARLGTTVDRRRAVLDGLIRVPQLAAELLQPLADSDQFSADQVSADQFRANESVAATRAKGGDSRVAV
ncbi:UDP-N-acetylglucosamine--N-acetylmuramyl-(pentapeptide) pyrophosphoryl-undecaprenol N-acetylglucosamine transferase [Arthrobacter sp. Bi26]|nr:UDP-N-acetylglucosamine--N-acetylmuramyl-(pentapeptide) pyrophosphoryl-undecaprenol N-acetylglucosamine transferase [Arthrobacter sp. Bi26]